MEMKKVSADDLESVEKDLLELSTSKIETIWIDGHFAYRSEEVADGTAPLSIIKEEEQ